MKKLLFVGHYGNIGGAGISLLRTARVAVSKGYEVRICLPGNSPMENRALSEGFSVVPYFCGPGSIEYYSGGPPLYRRTYFKKALARRPFAKAVTEAANSFRPDAVILNSITSSFMIPHLKKAGFRTGIFVRETFPEGGSKRMLSLYRRLLSRASCVFFISDFDKNFFDITESRTVTVRNSVPDSFFEELPKETACENLGIPKSSKFRVLYAGGCDPIKGANVISEASRLLPEGIELVVCGAEKSRMESLFEGCNCTVTYLGVCSDMRSAYGACNAVVLPITRSHQQRPLFEAGAAGVPVIISDYPEIAEYLGGGKNAVTVPPGDAHALAGAVIRLSADRDLCEKLAAENHTFSLENHSSSAVSGVIGEELARLTGPSVLYVTNIPSPYRVDFLSEMNGSVNVTAVFERKTSKGRDRNFFPKKRPDFPHLFPKGINIGSDKALNPSVKKLIKDPKFTDFIINGYSSPTEMLAISALRKLKKPYTMWIDGGLRREEEPNLLKKIKIHYLSGADRYLSPSAVSDEYLTYCGASQDRIIRYPFTSLYEADICEKPAGPGEKAENRKAFGLPEKGRIALAIGNFIKRKGFSELISAAASCPSLTVVICGGEPAPEHIKLISEKNIHNVRIVNFLPKEQIKRLLRACDFFVLPTREDIWGLVINEAMAMGLPVITTDRCVAGLTMVESGKNGEIIKSGITSSFEEPGLLEKNTAVALARFNSMSDEELFVLGLHACETAKEYTYENCVKKHLSVIKDRLQ